MSRSEFYQRHLDGISRSFAFCIAELETPLREWIGLSYILCRLADTIEDSAWPDQASQKASYQEFIRFVETAPAPGAVERWAADFPELPVAAERELLSEGAFFLSDLHSLPGPERDVIRGTVLNMVRGMEYFSGQSAQGAALRIRDLTEANQYCFFVAGIIGEMLTELVRLRYPQLPQDRSMIVDSVHFGLFLQKINILKDQMKDEREGRYLVPKRAQLRQEMRTNGEGAWRYLQRLPLECRGYRIFCAWSFFLGLLSLPWIDQSWTEQRELKIARVDAFKYLAQIKLQIGNNEALEKLFVKLREQSFPSSMMTSTEPEPATAHGYEWLRGLYQGALSSPDFSTLGIL